MKIPKDAKFSIELTIEEIYGLGAIARIEAALPEWAYVAFRPPKRDEMYVTFKDFTPQRSTGHEKTVPVIIIEEREEYILRGWLSANTVYVRDVYGGDVSIPAGWRYAGFRIPKAAEWFITPGRLAQIRSRLPVRNTAKVPLTCPRIIVIPDPADSSVED